METYDRYLYWLNNADEVSKARLSAISNDKSLIDELFSVNISFGTAGIRGVMDVGINRINMYTISSATKALADCITSHGQDFMSRGVCIAYDNRRNSREYALRAAEILCAKNIKVYIFDSLRPTPELSYTILHLKAAAGINITASHNTKEYNGYKVYWEDGAQISPEMASEIADRIKLIDELNVKGVGCKTAAQNGLLVWLNETDDEYYIDEVLRQSVAPKSDRSDIKLVYTPFHGAGCRIIPEILKRAGFTDVITIKEQMVNDPDFSTVSSPNPENTEGFALAIEYAEKNAADIIIGTDPDTDRVGMCVKYNGEYKAFTGNQIGVLLLDYIISERKKNGTMPENPAVVKSIVSTNLAKKICSHENVSVFDVLTGFKFIGEKIKEFEANGNYSFIFGFEESNGYLPGVYARDKDAVAASLLIAEMAWKYKRENINMFDRLALLNRQYGFYAETVLTKMYSGIDADEKRASVCESFRKNMPIEIEGLKITAVRDYKTALITYADGKTEPTGLPSSDVLYFELSDGSSLVVRPSGTEPKIKVYLMLTAENGQALEKKKNILQKYTEERIFAD